MADPHRRHGSATATPDDAILAAAGYAVLAKMRWRTPDWLVRSVAADLNIVAFDLDAAAESEWSHAPRFIDAQRDCLVTEWNMNQAPEDPHRVRDVWFNSPWGGAGVSKAAREAFPEVDLQAFPGTEAFLQRAVDQSRKHDLQVASLVGVTLDAWGLRIIRQADEVWFGRRFRFIDVHGNPGPQPPGPHMLLLNRPHVPEGGWPGGPRVRWDWDPRPKAPSRSQGK